MCLNKDPYGAALSQSIKVNSICLIEERVRARRPQKASQLSSKLKGRAVARIKGPLRPMKHLRMTGSLRGFQASAFCWFLSEPFCCWTQRSKTLQGNDGGEELWHLKGGKEREGEEKDKCFCRAETQSHVSKTELTEKWKSRLPSRLQPLFSLLLSGTAPPRRCAYRYTDPFSFFF